MRNTFLAIGLISSTIALVLSLTSWFGHTYIPSIVALVSGIISFYISRQHQYPKKPVQVIFIVAIIAISISMYRAYTIDTGIDSPNDTEVLD